MKKIIVVVALVVLAGVRAFAQPSKEVASRIDQVAALFRDNPTGYDTLFTSGFLAEVPADRLTAIFSPYYTSYGKIVGWNYIDSSHQWSAKARLRTSKHYTIELTIDLADSGSHLIDGLLLGLASPELKSLAEVRNKFAKMRGVTAMMIARLQDDGKIVPIEEYNPDTALAIGSAFKLYVLATLLKDINAGKRHWDDVIVLDSASRSFPSGQMHEWPVGTPVTLATAAAMMISISDNTAADLLIHTLGREHVEAMLSEAGNSHADLDKPFLTTQEAFKLKETNHDLGSRYITLSQEKKRAFLDREVAPFPHDSIGHVEGLIDKVEWFASPRDIANVYKYILEHSKSGEGAKVRGILAINPGLSIDKSRWDYVGYKGGSEPGVLNMSFLLHSKLNGGWYVITASWNDAGAPLKDTQFYGIVQRMIELAQ